MFYESDLYYSTLLPYNQIKSNILPFSSPQPQTLDGIKRCSMKILSIYIFLFVGLTSFGQSNLDKNKKAPTFSFKDTYGAIITHNSFKGKVLYIDVWATWCKPCLKGFKSFNELQDKYSEAEIAFMGVSIDESERLWKNTLMKESPKGTQVLAENGAASQIISDYNIARFPHYILIDQNGQLIAANAPKPDSQELDDLLNHLLKKNRQQIYSLSLIHISEPTRPY